MSDVIRVAAAQFATTLDVDENLDTCVRMIALAAAERPQLIVLPEFVNHLSVYEDGEHCRSVAVDLDGSFIRACADAATAAGAYVAMTPTVRRPDRVTVTSLLIGPDGSVLLANDKQTLMGNERAYLDAGESFGNVADASFGRVGSYACMDGVICEVPRALAQRGASVLTNSLNSFARDEASLHIPVRALENQVFVVAANKVGPLLPADQVTTFAQALGIGEDAFEGAGESQIVGPDGRVIAMAPLRGEAVVSAEIDLTDVDRARAATPTVTRRPACYAALTGGATDQPVDVGAEPLYVAAIRNRDEFDRAVAAGAVLIVSPEGMKVPGVVPDTVTLVSSRFVDGAHEAVIQRGESVLATQRQMHVSDRLPDVTVLGDDVTTVDGPWGRLVVAVGDDIRVPEYARLAAVAGANLLVVIHSPVSDRDVTLALTERAAENRMVIVAAGDGVDAAGQFVDGTAAIDLPADSLWNPVRSAPYDGTINQPRLVQSPGEPVIATVHPSRSLHREISKNTNLVDGRPRNVAALLTR